MAIGRINEVNQVPVTEATKSQDKVDGDFKFTLASAIDDAELQEKLTGLMKDNIRDMQKYRSLVKDFMNEVVNRSHKFSRENFLDRRGRHRVYGIIKLVDKNMDDLAEELVKDESDHLNVLGKIGEIRGLLIDIST